MEPIKVLSLINENDQNKKNYTNIKLNDIRVSSEDKLLFIIIKHIFFFNDNKLKFKAIKEETRKHEWITPFIDSLIASFIETKEFPLSYGMVIKYFCGFYENIKIDYADFIKELDKMKSKINFDLFGVAICFASYLNKNRNLLDLFSNLEKEPLIKDLELDNDTLTKNYLYYTVTDYCILYNIPIIPDKEYDTTGISKDKIIEEVKELKCYAEFCPINESYKNFLISLCSCLKDSQDIRINQDKNVVDFIDLIFIMLNIHLRNTNYWEDSYMSIIMNDIYKSSFQYCTENFNENYIDLVISYITKYGISSEDFLYIFLKGLNKNEFNKAFQNLNLKEDIGSINNKETIKTLIDKMYKKKKKKNKKKNDSISLNKDNKVNNIGKGNFSNEKADISIEFNKNQQIEIHSRELISKDNNEKIRKEDKKLNNENIIKEVNIDKTKDKNQDKKVFIDKTNIHKESIDITDKFNITKDSKIQKNKIIIQEENKYNFKEKNEKEEVEDINPKKIYEDFLNLKKEMENKIQILKKENENELQILKKENENVKKENENKIQILKKENENELQDMKEKINNMNEEIDSLQRENRKKDIEIKQLKDDFKFVNMDLERISFRDLSKRILNNMINFVNKKNGKLFAGLSKRKEKLNKINKCFKFDGIQFMQKPFKEICDKYYNSNIRSHIPDIAKNIKGQPIGLNNDPAGTILKKYYEVMIDSKDKKVFDFLLNKLSIKDEINDLYL